MSEECRVMRLLQEDLSNISSSGETKPLPPFSQSMLSVPNGGCMVFRMEAVWTQVPKSLLQCYLPAYIQSKQASFSCVCMCAHVRLCMLSSPE